jgi:DNA polymerase-1
VHQVLGHVEADAAIPALVAGIARLKVPLVAEVDEGANWDEAH